MALAGALFKVVVLLPLKSFQRLMDQMAAASSVEPLGLLHMWPLQ